MDHSGPLKQTDSECERPFTIILTTTSRFSAASQSVARAHAMRWSRRRARERKALVEASQRMVTGSASPPPTPRCVPSVLDVFLIDPFETTVLPIDRDMSFLLKLFHDHILPGYWPFKSFADTLNRFWISTALRDIVALNAIATRAIAEIEGSIDTVGDLAQVFYPHIAGRTGSASKFNCAYFRAQTIHHLNERLCEPDFAFAPANIYAVMLLLLLETCRGDRKSIRTHQSGLCSLVAAGGGLDKFPEQVIQPVITTSLLSSAVLQEQPPFCPRAAKSFMSKSTTFLLDSCPDPILDQLGTGLLKSSTVGLLSPRLHHLVSEHRRLVIFQELCRQRVLKPANPDLVNALTALSSIKYSILSLMFGKESTLLTPLQIVICYTLLITEINKISVKPRQSYSYALISQLKLALVQTIQSWTSHPATLIWILYVGAYSSRGERERAWFVSELAKIVHSTGLWTVQELEGVLLKFFYQKHVQGRSLPEIWEEMRLLRVSEFLRHAT